MGGAYINDAFDGRGDVWERVGVRRALIATVTALVAVAAVVIVWRAARPEPIVLAQADKRPLEARLREGAAARWRPYAEGREEVRVDTLTQLERRGQWRALAEAELLAGDTARAATALARAGASGDAESARAALALQTHDAAAALEHATRALQLLPGDGAAAWNRALALRDLGLARAATLAFQAIAARGEKGWSDEAKARAAALRRSIETRERSRVDAEGAGKAMVANGEPPPVDLVRERPVLMELYLERALAKIRDRRQLARLIPTAEEIDAIDARSASPSSMLRAPRFRAAAEGRPKQLIHDGAPDPVLACRLALEQAEQAWKAGDADTAAETARGLTQQTEVDPTDVPRRALLLLAVIVRTQGDAALADAYVDEARLLMPVR
jgi:hypothetical protein